jgi:hypothetical protein
LSAIASGTPPFSYTWKKNGVVLSGDVANAITINPMTPADVGTFAVEITGGNGGATNSAAISIAPGSVSPTNILAHANNNSLILSWPSNHTGWKLQMQTNNLGPKNGWATVTGSDATNVWTVPFNQTMPNAFFRLIYPGN